MLSIDDVLQRVPEISDRLTVTYCHIGSEVVTLDFRLRENGITVTGRRVFHRFDRPQLFHDPDDFVSCLWCSPGLEEIASPFERRSAIAAQLATKARHARLWLAVSLGAAAGTASVAAAEATPKFLSIPGLF